MINTKSSRGKIDTEGRPLGFKKKKKKAAERNQAVYVQGAAAFRLGTGQEVAMAVVPTKQGACSYPTHFRAHWNRRIACDERALTQDAVYCSVGVSGRGHLQGRGLLCPDLATKSRAQQQTLI